MNPLNLIPMPWRVALLGIAAALLVGAAFAWWHAHNVGQQQIGYDRAAGEYRDALEKQKDAARETERQWQEKWKGAVNERTELEKRLALSRASAAAADDRLRRATDDFSKRLSVASVEACRTAAETAAGLLGECSAAYRDVAAAADGHAADVQQCEAAWPE